MKAFTLFAAALVVAGCSDPGELERARTQHARARQENSRLRVEIQRMEEFREAESEATEGPPIKLPTDELAKPNEVERPPSIQPEIMADGRVLLGGAVVDRETLKKRLKQFADLNRSGELRIRGDKDVEFAHVHHVITVAQSAGIRQFFVVSQR